MKKITVYNDPGHAWAAVKTIDPQTLAEIIEAMRSAAARLKGPHCEFSNKRAAAALDSARAELEELTEDDEE